MVRRELSPRAYLGAAGGAGFAMLALVWLWIWAMPLTFLDPEYGAWVAKERLLARCDVGEMIVLGNSRAASGIIPALMPVRTTNLAVGGGEAIEALAAARRALACPHPPRTALIALAPGQFAQPDLFWERTVRFGFLGSSEVAELAARSRETHDWSVYDNGHGDGLPGWVRQTLYEARFPSLYFASLAKGGLFLRYWEDRQVRDAALASRGQYFFGTAPGCDRVAVEGHLKGFHPLPVLDRYFDDLLHLLTEHGVATVFVSMPVNEATARASQPALWAGFNRYLRRYQARYPSLRLIGPAMNGWPDALFGDGFSHLNPRGARMFSLLLGACLSGGEAACSLDWRGETFSRTAAR